MADISKIKLANGNEVLIKDAAGRARLDVAESAIGALETSKQNVINDSNKLAAAYVSLTKPEGTKLTSTDVQAAVYELESAIETGGTGSVVTVEKQETAESGYVATYVIKQGGEAVTGPKINIPKDYLVKSASIKKVTKADEPYSGAKVDDKYIDFVINVKEGSATDEHLYLPVNDLVDAYLGDEATIHLDSTTNTFSVKAIGMNQVNGLEDALALKADDADLQVEINRAKTAEAGKLAIADAGQMAYANKASGTVEGQTISGVKATGELSAALTGALGEADATATITSKAAFTPAGEIKLDGEAQGTNNKVLKGGSISVTVKDAATATAVTDITYNAYTPAGSVSLTKDNNNGTFQVSGTISKPDITVDDSSTDTFVKSLVAGDVDAASFDINKFHGGAAASLGAGFYTAGSDASLSEGAQASLTDQVTGDFVSQAIYVAANGYDADTETLTFSVAPTAKAVTDRGKFTPNTLQTLSGGRATVIDTSAFNGGAAASIDSDIFVAQKLPVVGNTASAVTAVTAALSATPEFTGDKFTPAFTGTADNIKFAGAKYLKQEIDTASFTPTEGTLSFAGSEHANLIPTAISYKKTTLGTLGVSAALPEDGLDVGNIVVASKKVTVTPDTAEE